MERLLDIKDAAECLYLFSFFALLLLFSWPQPSAHGAPGGVDNSLYAELLSRYVKSGVVDYQALKKEEGK